MKAGAAVRDEAFAPRADGVPVAIQLFSKLLIRGIVVDRSVEDKSTAEGQRLGRRTGADQGLQLLFQAGREQETRRKWPWQDVHPCNGESIEG